MRNRIQYWRSGVALCCAALFFVSCENVTAPEASTPTTTAPEEEPVVTDYERYALYLVAASGAIIHEEHCADTWPGPASDWPTVEAWYTSRRDTYQLQAYADGGGEYVVFGRIYTPGS